MHVFYTVIVFVAIVALIQIGIKLGAKGRYTDILRFLDDEKRANAARRKPIDDTLFVNPDIGELPVVEYAEDGSAPGAIARAQRAVLKCAERKMIRLDKPMTNNDIKMAFGAANLEIVAGYEENFNSYGRALLEWAEQLLKEGQTKEARRVLEHCVNMGTGIARCYTRLASIYALENDTDRLAHLLESVSRANQLARKDSVENDIRRIGGL